MSGYKKNTHHPNDPKYLDTVGSVLHCLCETKGFGWEQAFIRLAETSGRLGMMPDSRASIRGLLGELGFFLQAGSFAKRSVRDIQDECSELFSDGEAVIVNISDSVTYGKYLPLVPDTEKGRTDYSLHFPDDLRDRIAAEVWIAWKDGQDHSVAPRRKVSRQTSVRVNDTSGNETLHVFNENPNDNLIGDCAVRAVAGVLEISWTEAVKRLAAAQDYTGTVINSTRNIEALLRKEGFQEFDAIRRNGRILTGKQFCDIIHDMFPAGTRIFAFVGSNHVVAILVFDGDYKIVDTWDSTGRKITRYWAKYPERPGKRAERPAPKPEKLTGLNVGTRVRHKSFGVGEVTEINGSIAVISFPSAEKKLAVSWVIDNCKPE